jgi:hypothetical protein
MAQDTAGLPEVTTVGFKSTSKKFTYANHFTYKKRGRWDLLQKLCFMYLTKIKAFSTIQENVYKTVHINHKNVFSLVDEQVRGLYNVGKRPARIYIGRDTLMTFENHPDFPLYLNFNLPTKVAAQCGGFRAISIRNLPVTVLPTFVGVLVVPKEEM